MNILEEGLRYELLMTISDHLDKNLRFVNCQSFAEAEAVLAGVGEKLDSLKCAVEYIQDLVCVYGLKIWYDEYNKLVSTYIDVEWNYIRRKELPDEALKWAFSQNQDGGSTTSKIKTNKLRISENSLTFLGRVINALLIFSDPKKYSYFPNTMSFFDEETRKFSLTISTFALIKKCIGVNGLHGLDKLLSFQIVSEMYMIQTSIQKLAIKDKQNLSAEATAFGSLNNTVKLIDKYYSAAKKRLKPNLDSMTANLEKIGHLAILRVMALNELSLSARKDSQKLYMLLEATNESLVNEMTYAESNLQKEEIDAQNTFIKQLASLSVRVGLSDPIRKVYFKPKSIEFVPMLIMFCIYNLVGEIQWDNNLSMVVRNRKKIGTRWDPLRVLMGAHILMHQYSEDCSMLILYYIAQYLRSIVGAEVEKKKEEANQARENSYHLMLLFVQFAQIVGVDQIVSN